MHEITELVKEFDAKINLSDVQLYNIFGLQNGQHILKKYFGQVNCNIHQDSLMVTNMEDIANYILSCHGNQREYIAKDYNLFRKFLEKKLQKKKVFHVSKEAGVFVCRL